MPGPRLSAMSQVKPPLRPFRPPAPNILRFLRYHYLRLLRLRADSRMLARGVALGIFVGLTPTIPFHTALIILTAPLIRANLVAALASALWVSNPFTIPIHYGLAWWLGRRILPLDVGREDLSFWIKHLQEGGFFEAARALFHLGGQTLLILQVGGLVLAIFPSVLAYLLVQRFLQKRYPSRG
ncbi:DUF2062 domain-containing protein [Thermosulfuriphilus ammonigenes]|uniref:DUF2062 domain-containing protein n=2 Tax=Thermosulfuriphilus ammonigenes TaxID=1936021 RepID=A0A6G7PWG9_9BACT|nr:DUF2062 domain-containing protein [Thermosulfuriphilus ammonigenes]MBA2847797.1 hypothetical protein [Thermosulfuriphilus ammonigenes]QIJ72002.1 DUF2062 domain-containing protein [Thermosulfuriphilus ammonigenes]